MSAMRGLRQIAGRRKSAREIPPLIGNSSAMVRIKRLAAQVARTDSTVLITGETGVGKEVVARIIHHSSDLRDKIFLPVNCGTIPETLLESQLFGQAEGAAEEESAAEGFFHRARGGTIFLDGMSELTPRLQVILLRAIENKEILPLGAVDAIEVDVRIIAASSQDLGAAVEQGRFREDLFYRLNGFAIDIPPLRDRREDIPPLVEYLVRRHNQHLERSYRGVDDETLQILMSLPLRGNVRELHHLIEYAMIVGDGEWVRPSNLPPGIQPDPDQEGAAWGDHYASARQRLLKSES
ncbi:MAG: sigma 54-interacting transcriptional regulator [Candidatus Binatia bacterium]